VLVATAASFCGLALVLAACGGEPTSDSQGSVKQPSAASESDSATTEALTWTTYEVPGAGVAISFPPGWARATEALMPFLVDPRELVAVGTFDLAPGGENCTHNPENALEAMEPADGLIVIQERLDLEDGSAASYPGRPEHFGPDDGYTSEAVDCLDQRKAFLDRYIPFRDSGRRFYAHVALGNDAPPAIREEAWAILDRLEIRADGAK
jgi:hypothetical protein